MVYGEKDVTFDIEVFAIEGNTLLAVDMLEKGLTPFVGSQKTARDVEEARDALEVIYHQAGYPAVLVNIPEQTVENGVVRLEVIECRIRRVRVTGNRYFTMENILSDLPSLASGKIPYIPEIQRDIVAVNGNPDIEITPMLMPGRKLGTVDVELKVEDRLPLHGYLELNNRSPHDTEPLRLNAMLSYDNLWQKEHSISVQYQTAPEDRDEVETTAVSYVLPAPWNSNNVLAFYSINSDSESAFGEGFTTVGRGFILGCRYVMPLSPKGNYAHNLTAGVDYKDFDEDLSLGTGESLFTPITYLPLSFAYSAMLPNSTGYSRFSVGINMAFRGLVTDQQEFETKRFKSLGNYVYLTAGIERMQSLPAGFKLSVGLDGQIANQPLIANEQYFAGGMESVRGYKENEEAGDNALHATVKLEALDLGVLLSGGEQVSAVPYVFFDCADLRILDPLPGEDQPSTLRATGVGVKGVIGEHFNYEAVCGVPLSGTDRTRSGDYTCFFTVRYVF